MPDSVLKIGSLVMINAVRTPGRVTAIAKERRGIKYSDRYIDQGKFREAVFALSQLTQIGRKNA